jgi:aspartate racemase
VTAAASPGRARHIGIVGVSAEGAALCYRTICVEGADLLGRHDHPEVTLHTHPLARYMEAIDVDDWHRVAELMLDSAQRLAGAGAELLICPDNTVHEAWPEIASRAPLPWLHIAEVVADEAASLGFRRLAILGTRYLMEGGVYPPALAARGLEWRIPEPGERRRINEIIFEELVYGRFEDAARLEFHEILARMGTEGCDAAVLGCTEIPLLIRAGEAPWPVLDSTRLLARAALQTAAADDVPTNETGEGR